MTWPLIILSIFSIGLGAYLILSNRLHGLPGPGRRPA